MKVNPLSELFLSTFPYFLTWNFDSRDKHVMVHWLLVSHLSLSHTPGMVSWWWIQKLVRDMVLCKYWLLLWLLGLWLLSLLHWFHIYICNYYPCLVLGHKLHMIASVNVYFAIPYSELPHPSKWQLHEGNEISHLSYFFLPSV